MWTVVWHTLTLVRRIADLAKGCLYLANVWVEGHGHVRDVTAASLTEAADKVNTNQHL